MRRYVGTFFGHPWLYLLPFVVVLAGSTLLARRAVEKATPYRAEATVAVNLDPTRARVVGEQPLAEQYAELLGELMGSDGFVVTALRRTSLGLGLAGNDERAMVRSVRSHWHQHSAGPNTLRVQYDCHEAELCAEVVAAVLGTFRDEVTAGAIAGKQAALEFYEQQVQSAELWLRALAPTDPAHDSAVETYNILLNRLTEARLDRAIEQQDRQAAFKVISPPRVPDTEASALRQAAFPLVLGGVLGTMLVLITVVLVTWTDTTVRSPEDVFERVGLQTVCVVPHARPDRRAHRLASARATPAMTGRWLRSWRIPWHRSGRHHPQPLHVEENNVRG